MTQTTPRGPADNVLFINGRVETDDGAALPSNITVERVCAGQTRQQVHADLRGNFSFDMGMRINEMPDVTVTPGLGSNAAEQQASGVNTGSNPQLGISRQVLWSCEIRAVASGFRSSSASLSSYSPSQTIDVGTIFLQRGEKVEGTTISANSYQAPKDAKKAYDKGAESMKKGNLAEAQKQLEKAVQIYPQYATAWYQLGHLYEQQNQSQAAQNAYEKAIAGDSKFVPPYVAMAALAAREGNWKQALTMSDRGLQLDPLNYPGAYYFNSLANYRLNNLPAAEKGARSAERYDRQQRFPQIHLLLGSILSDSKAYAEAITEFTAFLKLVPDSKDGDAVKAKIATLEKLAADSSDE